MLNLLCFVLALEGEISAAEGVDGFVSGLLLGESLEGFDDGGEFLGEFIVALFLVLLSPLADTKGAEDFGGPLGRAFNNAFQSSGERGSELLGGNGFFDSGGGEDGGELGLESITENLALAGKLSVFDALGEEGGVGSVDDCEGSDDGCCIFHCIGIGLGIVDPSAFDPDLGQA